MILLRDHPLLLGCRVLLWPEGRQHSNWLGYDPTPTFTGTPGVSGSGAYPAVSFGGSDSYTLGTVQNYGTGTKDITIAFRVLNTSTPSSGTSQMILCGRTASPSSGFACLLANNNGGDNSFVFKIHGTASQRIAINEPTTAATWLNVDSVVVMAYESSSRTIAIWVNGELRTRAADAGQNWDPWGTTGLLTVAADEAGSEGFVGNIGPVLVYDRCLTDGEIFELMQDHQWPFLVDDDKVMPTDLVFTFTTSVGVRQAEADGAPAFYSTSVDASAAFTGDVASVPANAGTYRTAVAARSAWAGSFPTFKRYRTNVTVTSLSAGGAPHNYATSVLVSPAYSVRLDGRIDLLDSFRFRR